MIWKAITNLHRTRFAKTYTPEKRRSSLAKRGCQCKFKLTREQLPIRRSSYLRQTPRHSKIGIEEHMRWLTVLVLLIGLQGQTSPSLENRTRVHFTVLNCADSHNQALKPRIGVNNLGERREETQVQYNIRATSLGFEGEMFLSPGFYNVGVILGGGCQDSIMLPVVSNQDQDVLFIGFHGWSLRNGTMMIAGTVPLTGYSASVVYWPQEQNGDGPKTLVERPARVQGNAYYAVGLGPGTVRLRISTPDGSNHLDFKIGRIGSGAQRFLTFNVSEQDVKNALRHPLPPP